MTSDCWYIAEIGYEIVEILFSRPLCHWNIINRLCRASPIFFNIKFRFRTWASSKKWRSEISFHDEIYEICQDESRGLLLHSWASFIHRRPKPDTSITSWWYRSPSECRPGNFGNKIISSNEPWEVAVRYQRMAVRRRLAPAVSAFATYACFTGDFQNLCYEYISIKVSYNLISCQCVTAKSLPKIT